MVNTFCFGEKVRGGGESNAPKIVQVSPLSGRFRHG